VRGRGALGGQALTRRLPASVVLSVLISRTSAHCNRFAIDGQTVNQLQTDNSSRLTRSGTRLQPSRSQSVFRPRRSPHNEESQASGLKGYQRQYKRRKAAGLCTATGCPEEAKVGHTHCSRHLELMCRQSKQRYKSRVRESLCIYCGERPGFWGLRCIICRQKFSKDPLPSGARTALRLYRKAERQRDFEYAQVEARLAARKLLATRDITGKRARALRLYMGIDGGKWLTYEEVGELMGISKQAVRQLLRPSKMTLEGILGDRIPWKSVLQRRSRRSESKAVTLKRSKPQISTSSRSKRSRTNEVRA
jgi:hypothetical protein